MIIILLDKATFLELYRHSYGSVWEVQGLRPTWANQVQRSSHCLAIEVSGPQKGKEVKLD